MSRSLDSSTATALAGSTVYALNLVTMDFPDGDLNLHTGYGEITVNSVTYTGAGNLGQVSEIEETTDLRATGITLSLSGVPSELLSKVLSENIRNRAIRVYFCTCDENHTIIGSPILIFDGKMDTMSIDDQGTTSVIQVTAESRLIDLGRPRTQVYTDEFQRTIDSDDNSLEYLADLANKSNSFNWGGPAPSFVLKSRSVRT